jgi:hypothetical protein
VEKKSNELCGRMKCAEKDNEASLKEEDGRKQG